MRVLSPDACGATRRHQRIHACAECHGARVLKRPQGTRALQYMWNYLQYMWNIYVELLCICFPPNNGMLRVPGLMLSTQD